MEEKNLHIKQLKNGYTATLCSYEKNKGGLSGTREENFILDPVPDVIVQMFNGKFGKGISTAKDRERSFNKAEEEAEASEEK
jgi:hypothetical protein